MKLSKNFYLSEFTLSAGIRIEPTDEQLFCLRVLCRDVLQPIRNQFGTVTITSGVRNQESYEALVAKGYPASATSDHFAWSKVNPKGTGAADFTCPDADLMDVFHFIQEHLYYHIGQVIYYPEKSFIHVSNRYSKIFRKPDTRKEATRVMVRQAGKFNPYPRKSPVVCGKGLKWPWNK